MESRAFIERLLGLDVPEPPSDTAEAAELVRMYGLEGLAIARHRREGAFLPEELVTDFLPAYHMRGLRTTLTLESANRALGVLDRVGVPAVLIKGAALVESGLYPDPGARRMDDADLVVPFAAAENDPWPEPDELYDDVYVSYEGGLR